MSIIDSGVRLRANDITYPLAGNRDLAGKEVAVYNDGNMGLELVATDYVLALPAHVKAEGVEKAFRYYVGESLGYGYWQGGNFGYIHRWDTVENKPLLYQYPFSGAGIDLDFPVIGSICGSRVGDWWLGVGGWFEIVTPTWTDPSWDWSKGFTYYTDNTKCNGVVYAYRIGATYYLRIWTLTDGIWGYVTHSGWDGIDNPYLYFEGAGMWEWDGDVYYVAIDALSENSKYCVNGVLIKGWSSFYGFMGSISVSNNFTYMMSLTEGGLDYLIYSKTDLVAVFPYDEHRGDDYSYLIGTDKYLAVNGYADGKYCYAIGNTTSNWLSGGFYDFDGGEDGKALISTGGSGDYQLQGFDPVTNTWTDYGRPWG